MRMCLKTESELVGVDDMMPIVVWSRYFLMAQGYGVTKIREEW